MIKHVEGDLIEMASEFDIIAHGANCFCKMKRGIAPQMQKAFNVQEAELEQPKYAGKEWKLGKMSWVKRGDLYVANLYTQYHWKEPSRYGIPLDYRALGASLHTLWKFCYVHRLWKVGLPWIGCGLAGGDKKIVEHSINEHLGKMDVTIVTYAG